MIEEVTKSVRRGKTVDDAFIDSLYADMTALYRLDSIDTGAVSSGGKKALGKLPGASVALLSVLAATWVLIIVFFLYDKYKNLKKK